MDANELINALLPYLGYGDIKISIKGVWYDISGIDLEVFEDYDENGEIVDETCHVILNAKEM